MKQTRNFPIAVITEKGELSVRNGHPWIYAEEVTEKNGEFENGCLTDIFSSKNAYLGTGFFSEKSKIAFRILSTNANDKFDAAFFERRVKYAIDYRKTVMGNDFSCCRLIFGEADGLPGLTVDRFSNILVAQVLSFGTDKIKNVIFAAIYKILNEYDDKIDGIYERNDSAIRELEGLEQYKGWYENFSHPESTITEITENGVKYTVDFENGQKTGYFLDQKYNRREVARFSKGKNVLDCFTHTGSFALCAAIGGANSVSAVDVSETALSAAKENARKNGLENKIDFICADIFDFLPKLCDEKSRKFDFIILDPPAFTKSRKTIFSAASGYREINRRAMKLLPRGGYLATCSCSHFMEEKLFIKMLKEAALDADVQLKQIEARQQSPDHPILWNVPETDYLKFYIFQIV